MSTFDAIIIGGGLSGLSAAVELSVLGRKVLVLEQHRHCGGRTYSFLDTATGCSVDNGQHLMLGCYHATRRFLKIIGSDHLARLQPALRIDFLRPPYHHDHLACAELPVPLHLLSGLLGFTALPFKDRLQLVRVAKELLSTSPEKELVLDQMTVEEWLNQLGQSEISKKYLWNVITVGAMNNTSKNVSALMLFRILRAAFLQKKDNASLFIPRTGLSELLVNPAIQFIEARGGVVQTGVAVKRLLANGTHMTSVQTTDQRELQAPSFISTVPWYSFEEILSASEYPSQRADKNISERERSTVFTSSPIISLHLWLDREITTLDFAALLETRIQWLFNKWTLLHKDKCEADIRQYLSLVISGAEEFIRLPKEELVGMAMEDLRRVLPRAHEAKVIRSLVVKEKRATFIPGPGLEKIRPGAKTQFDNLFLAGDWTATGYPATIEGAVMSGKTAADMLG